MVNVFFTQEDVLTSLIMGIAISAAFPIGAVIALNINYPDRINADIAAFGSGIFFAAISFSLVHESIIERNTITIAIRFINGAVVFSFSNHELLKKISQSSGKDNKNQGGNPQSVLIGSISDSVPESIFIGVVIALNIQGLLGAVIVLFVGNLATTLDGTKRMVELGEKENDENKINRSKTIILKWLLVFLIVSISSPIGYFLVKSLNHEQISVILGFVAGVLMSFITEDLIPEAFKKSNYHIGLSSSFEFLLGFALFSIL